MTKRRPPELGDAPIEERYHGLMNHLASSLDEVLNGKAAIANKRRQTGFVLLVFPFGSTEGRANYISNGADRQDIVRLFKEQIARFEEQTGGES